MGKKQGKGIFDWKDGSKYEGEMKDGWYHGNGKFIYPNGVVYEGEFVKG